VSAFSAILLLAEAATAQPNGFEYVRALYESAYTDDEVKFTSIIGNEFGFFAAPDFVVPMKFKEFKQFAQMCVSPKFISLNEAHKASGMTGVTVSAQCTPLSDKTSVERKFDFWEVNGKIIAIRPTGMPE